MRFPDEAAVRRLAQRLAALGGRRLDDASPHVDVRLRDGTRFHAVLAPLARPGTLVSLRVPPRRAMTHGRAGGRGHARAAAAPSCVERLVASRAAFLVSGGTGTGKTTLLAALLSLADPRERLVLVEDASELRPDHPHVVGLEARPANVEGAGQVDLRTLVRQALRMRPDRLVVGEVRGGEVVDLLAALNTGHEGGCGTLHANSAARRPGPDRGAGPGGRPRPRRGAQPARLGRRRGRPPRPRSRRRPAGRRDRRAPPRGRRPGRRCGRRCGSAPATSWCRGPGLDRLTAVLEDAEP